MKKEKVNKYSFPLLIAGVLLISTTLAFAQPVVPGFNVEVYANVPQPVKLAFDPTGVLYVGNNGVDAKIHRVGIGGSPVEEYGDTSFPDPDSVAFDASGAISGTPGSVLVGNGGDPGFIAAILPDQTTITALGSGFGLGNPAYLEFDRTGRLLIADQAPPFRALAATVTDIVELGDSFLALTVDGSNRVYSAFLKNQIKVYASDGTELPDLTPIDNSRYYFFGLEFGPYDSVWRGHLFVSAEDSNIYRIKTDGTIILFGTGFSVDNRSDHAFGPDGALYVSDVNENVIYRVSPTDLLTVSIDIKPGSYPNSINPRSKGKIPVAILSSMDFDAPTVVDTESLTFGRTGDEESLAFCSPSSEDVNGDGFVDLVCHFYTQMTGFECGDDEGILKGQTVDETPVEGNDSVRIVPSACR